MPPKQKPGRSKQDYETPDDFLQAVKARLGIASFTVDLAATPANSKGWQCLTEEDDSLTMLWLYDGWCWLNPPYSNLRPWAEKAWEESRRGAHIAMLVPSSTGANWWRDWVDKKAYTLLLNGRITFVGETTPYPKDCALLLYAPFLQGGYTVWNWRA